MKNNPSRRKFLKNTFLTSVLAATSTGIIKAESKSKLETEECNPVTLDYYGQGPFYKSNAPIVSNNLLVPEGEPGTRLIISGMVRDLDCSKVIPNTEIDIWHAKDNGQYDNNGYNCRGKALSNAQGLYIFETILPGKYLNGSQYRPRHIHFKITPPGYPSMITQLYFEGDTDIQWDAAASIRSGTYDATHRIIPIQKNVAGKYEGTWDITIDGNGVLSNNKEIHLDKGVIYSASPNPFENEVVIKYGIFHAAKVSLEVFNMNGQQMAVLEEQFVSPEKYEVIWKPEANIQRGMYWAVLKVNDLQVNYFKIIKQ